MDVTRRDGRMQTIFEMSERYGAQYVQKHARRIAQRDLERRARYAFSSTNRPNEANGSARTQTNRVRLSQRAASTPWINSNTFHAHIKSWVLGRENFSFVWMQIIPLYLRYDILLRQI